MQIKRIISACIVSSLLIVNNNTYTIQADELKYIDIKPIQDIDKQVEDLYTQISEELNIDTIFIKELHTIAGGKAIYADTKPNVYSDETIKSMKGPMEIEGANTVYQQAKFIDCPDDTIERPSKYYLPDAIYSVAYDITALMGQRYNYNRDSMQIYFDSLQEDVKQTIVFYEAVLLYIGEKEETVNKLYQAYEKILYDKQSNENIVEELEDGTLKIKDKFLNTINNIGIKDKNTIKTLAIILSFDKNLAINDNIESVKDEYIVPYRLNYTSRENMMIAAMSLTGKVRYVWGGGHSGASHIDGINPMWSLWNNLYPCEPYTETIDENNNTITVNNEGFGTCIKPSGSWCPIHGYTSSEYHGESINNLEDYINLRATTFNNTELFSDKYKELLSKVDYSEGINVHTLDGLDCSGYASWLYNQITSKYEINSTAMYFVNQNGLEEVPFGEELLPGDIFAWTTHIVVIIGKVKDNSKAYVTIEQTPNVLKFGVVYYSGASSEDIEYAKQISSEANELIGGLNSEYEEPHVYCMDTVGHYTQTQEVTAENEDNDNEIESEYKTTEVWFPAREEDPEYDPYKLVPDSYEYWEQRFVENGYILTYYTKIDITQCEESSDSKEEDNIETETVQLQYHAIGRFKDKFIDEDTIIEDTNTKIKDMCALDIIQYTLTKLPVSYVTGYNRYDGDLFKKDKISSNIGISIEASK